MKNTFSSFTNLIAVAACALTLGSCSRAEYAMLPQGSSYHGVTRVATPVAPAAAPAEAAPIAEAQEPAQAVAPKAVQPAAVAQAPAARASSKVVPEAVSSTAATSGPATVAANPAQKLNAFQRLALNKVTRKVDKLMQKATARQHDNTASTTRGGGISGNLRIGLILLLIGLLLGLINSLVGAIVAIIGLIFIVLWLLDQA